MSSPESVLRPAPCRLAHFTDRNRALRAPRAGKADVIATTQHHKEKIDGSPIGPRPPRSR